MTKSIPPSSSTQRSAAAFRLSNCTRDIRLQNHPPPRHPDGTYAPHIRAADAYDARTLPDPRNLSRRLLRLGLVAADDAGVCAEPDEGARLRAADVAGAARHEGYAVVCCGRSRALAFDFVYLALAPVSVPKMPSFQTSLRYSDRGTAIVIAVCEGQLGAGQVCRDLFGHLKGGTGAIEGASDERLCLQHQFPSRFNLG
jgi:hypothetical protein